MIKNFDESQGVDCHSDSPRAEKNPFDYEQQGILRYTQDDSVYVLNFSFAICNLFGIWCFEF